MNARLPATALVLLLFASPSARAETKIGFRQLGSTVPVVVQRGTKAVVKIRSNFTLDEAYRVFFDRPGISMRFMETEPIDAPRRGRGRPGTPFRFEAEVPADQPAGVYELRVATRQAVSSVSHLLVSDYPVVEEAEGENGAPGSAQSVSVPCAVAGMCERDEDVDFYRIEGKAGQELTIQIYAQRVTEAVHSMQCGGGVYLMDAILTLYGPAGQVVAQNDNFFGGDSFLYVKLPEDGPYVLEVRDARYVGDQKYVYCVEISDRPFAHAVFPPAVQRGKSAEVEVIGHMLSGLEKTTIDAGRIDNSSGHDDGDVERANAGDLRSERRRGRETRAERVAVNDDFPQIEVRINTPHGPTNPVPVLVGEHPQVVADGSNTSLDKAMTIALPAGVNGRFAGDGQAHYYAFEAHKGGYYLFEVVADALGLPLDSVIEIYDAEGRKLAEADDPPSGGQTKDAKLYFQAPAEGRYVVAVRDLHDRGGQRFLYHLRAEPSGPDFEVHGEYYYAQLAPGTRMIWFARINRLNGFNGPVEMHVEGLPDGVSLTPVTIPPGMDHCGLILSADEDAAIGASLVRVCGRATIRGSDGNSREIVRYGRVTCELQTQGGGQAKWPIHTQLIGVTKPLDLVKVAAEPDEITLAPGGRAQIKVRIERSEDYKDPVTLDMAFKYFNNVLGAQLPPGVTVAQGSTGRLSGDEREGVIILEAAKNALPVERLPIAVVARVSITFSITTNYASNPVYLTVVRDTSDGGGASGGRGRR